MSKAKIIEAFKELALIYSIFGDTYRQRAYEAAIKTIESTTIPPLELKGTKTIGKSIYEAITEITNTGKLKKLKSLRDKYKIYEKFSKIPNFGPSLIRKIILAEITTIEQLKNNPSFKLTNAQKMSLKYYKDLNKSIPRADTKAIGDLFIRAVQKLDKTFSGEIVGSYRRGATKNGDVDVVVWSKKDNTNILRKLRDKIKSSPDYVATLTVGSRFTFYFRYKGTVRQIDIFNAPYAEHIAHILYGTGSKEFNISMRKKLKSLGYKLSRHGLKKISTNKYVPIHSEQQIFTIAEMPYLPPTRR